MSFVQQLVLESAGWEEGKSHAKQHYLWCIS